MKGKVIKSVYVEMDPGDGTHYEFIISRKDNDRLIIAKGDRGAEFSTYVYNEDSVLRFMAECQALQNVESDLYEGFVLNNKLLEKSYIGYMVEHSHCNKWTALAAIQAMHYYYKMGV